MKDLTKELLQLLEKAKQDKKCLVELKNTAVSGMEFELAAELRFLETSLFPESEEVKIAKKQAKDLRLLFQMVELNISEDIAWLIAATLKTYNKKKGNFDLKNAVELISKRKEYFND